MDFDHQPRVRARRRSSCSALPSTTIMELNDLVDSSDSDGRGGGSRRRYKRESLGSFLRFNNSIHSSVASVSDTSACAMSGEGSDLETAHHDSDNDEDDDDNNDSMQLTGTDVVDHHQQQHDGARTTTSGTSHPDDGSDTEQADQIKTKKKKKKKKSAKESKKEKPSRRRMQRRSSWSGAMTTEAPQEYEMDHHHRDLPSFMQEHVPLEVTPLLSPDEEPVLIYELNDEPDPLRRRMNRQSSWHTSFSHHDDDDGVISSFKSSTTSGSMSMYEEQHFEQNGTIITSSPSSTHPYDMTTITDEHAERPIPEKRRSRRTRRSAPLEGSTGDEESASITTNNENNNSSSNSMDATSQPYNTTTMTDEHMERPIPEKRRSRRTTRSASVEYSTGDKESASITANNENNNSSSNSMDTTMSPSSNTNDAAKTKESIDGTSNTDERQEFQAPPVKEVKRTLLMVKHVHSGAARARRRASWSASTVNYLDEYVPSSPKRSPQQFVAEVFSSLKKNSPDTEEEEYARFVQSQEHDAPMDVFVESQPPSSVEYQNPEMSPDGDAATNDNHGSHQGHRRRTERRLSWHTSSTGYGESTSTIDTRMSQTSQKSQTFVMDLNEPNKHWKAKEVLEEEVAHEVSQDRRTRPRSWKLGKANQSDRSRSPDLVVVSSANMPQHDRPLLSSSDRGISCVQLTAFGDVTTIGCDR